MDIPKNIKYKLKWNYKTPDINWNLFHSQEEWNQTLIAKINEASTGTYQRTMKSDLFEIAMNSKVLDIIKTFEFYDEKTQKIGTKYTIVINNNIKENCLYVYQEQLKDLKAIPYLDLADEQYELKEKPISEYTDEEIKEYKDKLITEIEILNY